MLARAHTFTVEGLCTRHVTVEVDVRAGLPSFSIIGLADTAVREARERVRTAILNSGFEFPARRITANLAPGDVPKAGPGLDLALACAILGATDQLPRERLDTHALLGELGLDGSVRPARGALAVAEATRRAGLHGLALAPADAHEASLVEGLRVSAVGRLTSAVRVLRGGRGDAPPPPISSGGAPQSEPDLADVRGQQHAVRALVVAAAGGHNLLLSGAPGTGKTMLALRAPSILPRLSADEALEVTRIESLAGVRVRGLRDRPPFRAPHHSITAAGLIGGGRSDAAGEAVLAHNGVLFLDELSEFQRSTLQALRQPLEEGRVVISRARHRAAYPSRFMLLAATNPCPCGFAGEHERCTCTDAELVLHRRRIGGPLLDRIDLFAALVREHGTSGRLAPTTSSADAHEQILEARARQRHRLRGEPVALNAHLDASVLERHLDLEDGGRELVRRAGSAGLLSARGQHRVLRVARTIADLAGHDRVCARHVGAALALRPHAPDGREDGR